MNRSTFVSILGAMAILATTSEALAQAVSGNINGTVFDATRRWCFWFRARS
jgi:hypothetical protein